MKNSLIDRQVIDRFNWKVVNLEVKIKNVDEKVKIENKEINGEVFSSDIKEVNEKFNKLLFEIVACFSITVLI